MAHILLLTPQLPYPAHQGTSLRNLHMLKALAQRHQVSLLSFAEGDALPELEPLQALCRVLPPVRVPARSSMDRIRQLADQLTARRGPTSAKPGILGQPDSSADRRFISRQSRVWSWGPTSAWCGSVSPKPVSCSTATMRKRSCNAEPCGSICRSFPLAGRSLFGTANRQVGAVRKVGLAAG